MGCGWGGTAGKPHGRHWKAQPLDSANFLLTRPFRAFAWTLVGTPTPPVTPEVAGSSPVAPVLCTSRFRPMTRTRIRSEPWICQVLSRPGTSTIRAGAS